MIYGWVAQWGVLTLHHSGVLGSILKSCYCQCLVYVRVLFVTVWVLCLWLSKTCRWWTGYAKLPPKCVCVYGALQ